MIIIPGLVQPFSHAIIATDSMSTLEKIRTGQVYADWVTPLQSSRLEKLTWLFCPGHSGVRGNERADWLAGLAKPDGATLTLDPPAVLRAVLAHTQGEDIPESHTMNILSEKKVQRGQGRKEDLCGAARRIHNQLLFETISIPTLRWTVQRRAEQIWVCPDCEEADSTTV